MKVLIVTNRIKVVIDDDIKNAFEFLSRKTPLKYDLSYLVTDLELQFKSFTSNNVHGTTGTKEKLAPLIIGTYDLIVFLYGVQSAVLPNGGVVTAWSFWEGLNGAEYIEIPTYPYADQIGWIGRTLSHETIHGLCKIVNRKGRNVLDEMDSTLVNGVWTPYYKNDDPEALDGNYARTINNLSPYWDIFNTMPTYKYFKPSEVVGLKHELVSKLDIIREQFGFPMRITSGLRTKAQNDALADSASDSSHLSGLAADIACTDSFKRFKLIKTAYSNGIRRIGEGKDFIHLDVDSSKPQDVFWNYYK